MPSLEEVKKTLSNLKEESATGPDGLPTRVLKRCAEELAKPFWLLAKVVLTERRWPETWLTRWVLPLYKRKAVWQANNYRGVHLTAQLFKATKKLLLHQFREYLTSFTCMGDKQFAYKQKRDARDALAFLALT